MAPAKHEQDIVVQIAQNFKGIDINPTKLKKLVKAVCNNFTRYETGDANYEISIAIVNDAQIRKVNKQFLNRVYSTDVISFDLSNDENQNLSPRESKTSLFDKPLRGKLRAGSERSRRSKDLKLFELVVNGEMAVKEAACRGHSDEAELALYITHGLLHNLGFDDSTPDQAQKMHDAEDEFLQQHGFGLVYNNST